MKFKKTILLKSLLISILYVGLGTVSLFGSNPNFSFSGDWSALLGLLTLPVNILGFAIAYMESDNYNLIILTQTVVFLVFWLIVYRIWVKRSQKKLLK